MVRNARDSESDAPDAVDAAEAAIVAKLTRSPPADSRCPPDVVRWNRGIPTLQFQADVGTYICGRRGEGRDFGQQKTAYQSVLVAASAAWSQSH